MSPAIPVPTMAMFSELGSSAMLPMLSDYTLRYEGIERCVRDKEVRGARKETGSWGLDRCNFFSIIGCLKTGCTCQSKPFA